jgi:hypothetical protein
MKSQKPLLQVGWREWLSLPQIGVPAIRAKLDTGARTSALHTFQQETFRENGQRKVRFGVHPLRRRTDIAIFCVADVIDERIVSDSGGHRERRLVIRTEVQLGDHRWPIEITLANRETMLFRMLLGRSAMQNQLLINAGASYVMGRSLRNSYENWKKRPQYKGKEI